MKTNVFIIAALSGFVASAAVAQVTTFDPEGGAEDAVEDLEEQIEDDRERDFDRFGNDGRQVGNYGSLALRGTSTNDDGVTDSDFGLGLRWGTFDGVNGFDITASLNYGETDGEETKNTLLAGADYRRDLTSNIFAYGKADVAYDRLAESEGEFEDDLFVGAGLGYRIFNTADTQWSVQAGPGYRSFTRVTSPDGAPVVETEDIDEAAGSVSSNVLRSLSETSYVTNDTDIIFSESATSLINELALNVAMNETLSLRTSLISKLNDQDDSSLQDGINTFGVSVIYNFE